MSTYHVIKWISSKGDENIVIKEEGGARAQLDALTKFHVTGRPSSEQYRRTRAQQASKQFTPEVAWLLYEGQVK